MAARDSSLGTARDVPSVRGPEVVSGLATPAEEAAWDSLRERITVSLRPLGASLAVGLLRLVTASWVLASLQVGWGSAADGRRVALVLVAFACTAQLTASVFAFLGRDDGAGTAMGQLALIWLVVGLSMLTLPPAATSEAPGVFLLFAGVSLLLSATSTAAGKRVPAAVLTFAGMRFPTGAREPGAGTT